MTEIGNEEASPVCFLFMNKVSFLLLLKFDVIQGFKYGEIDFFLSQTWIITQILH